MHRTWVEINETALANNIQSLRGLLAPETRFCAVLKANAYGHGLNEVSRIASRQGVDAFAVDLLDDALYLRDQYPSALILVLGWVVPDRLKEAIEAGIHLTVYDRDRVRELQEIGAGLAKAAQIHVKIETGTCRQGVLMPHLGDLLDEIKRSAYVELVGVSTHFANVENPADTAFATMQYNQFQEALQMIEGRGFEPTWIHSACSAAIILYPATHDTLVRAGISMYGLWSSKETEMTARRHRIPCDLQPVLSWKTRVAQVKPLRVGTPVGYGLTETMSKNGQIAILPVGYWDGYDRRLSSVGEVIIKGHRCKVIGRVCMNMCMVDVSSVPQLVPGEEAVLIGQSGAHRMTADVLAGHMRTIHYEVVTRINPQLPRVVTRTQQN